MSRSLSCLRLTMVTLLQLYSMVIFTSKTLIVLALQETQVKTLTYAFIYGAGDAKLGHSLSPELSDAQKKTLGGDLRRKFLDAIPGLEPLIDAVKIKVRSTGRLRALDSRPIFCRAEHAALNYLVAVSRCHPQ